MTHDEQNSVVIDRGSIPNVNDPQPSGGSISNPNGPERSARGDRSELPPGASATPLESGSASGAEQLAAFAVGVKQAMERQVDLMGRVNDLYTRYEAQRRITVDLMNARAAMRLAFYHAHEHGLEWRDLVDGSAPERSSVIASGKMQIVVGQQYKGGIYRASGGWSDSRPVARRAMTSPRRR